MRPSFGWRDLAGFNRIGVWGLGVEGQANVRKLNQMGVEPMLVDDHSVGDEVVATADGGIEVLATCEVVVKTPGISRYRGDLAWLEDRGIPVVGGLGLWLNEASVGKVICVTGTKGKSTTVSIAGHLARSLGVNCFVGGNLGIPPYDTNVPADFDLWVIEVSSYQATDVAVTPPVVGVTSLHPDHLDWHRTAEAYYRDKLSMTSQAGAQLTVCGDDPQLRARRSLLGPRVRWVDLPDDAQWWEQLRLFGRHNAVNATLAAALLAEAGVDAAADNDALSAAATGFLGLQSRLQQVATIGEVEFFDDSLSTNVLPTIAAIDSFPGRPVALILGGFDRGIDYGPLAQHLARRTAPTLAVALPASGERIAAAIETVAAPGVEVLRCTDLSHAVSVAYDWVKPAGVVLLSPAAPSFGQFRDFRERSAAFTQAARECAAR